MDIEDMENVPPDGRDPEARTPSDPDLTWGSTRRAILAGALQLTVFRHPRSIIHGHWGPQGYKEWCEHEGGRLLASGSWEECEVIQERVGVGVSACALFARGRRSA